ncbi:uncharacterized protein LOC62_04G005618 [Vanrija pseudolonga]|uniref:Uncharacterized protein n=1 Tax=Vanrija pseudolonga TaxID=143232 RepID=A0AAF0Y8Z7_9TREE|nr:hypothetical protein LOC62_04G005618 [Vanrija pseudolonga]
MLSHDRKPSRSNSTSSVASTSSSRSTRSADDIYDRLVRAYVGPQHAAGFQLWSAGNLRVGGRDLAMTLADVVELAASLHDDERFELLDITYLDTERDEWKASYRLNSQPSTPASSVDSLA